MIYLRKFKNFFFRSSQIETYSDQIKTSVIHRARCARALHYPNHMNPSRFKGISREWHCPWQKSYQIKNEEIKYDYLGSYNQKIDPAGTPVLYTFMRTVLLIQNKKLKIHLAPPGMLPRTPKGCEHPWLGNPVLEARIFQPSPILTCIRLKITKTGKTLLLVETKNSLLGHVEQNCTSN